MSSSVSHLAKMADFHEQLASLGIQGATATAAALSGQADDYHNQPALEQAWAIKTMKYAETHMKLIQSVDAAQLRLTRSDDAIYSEYMKHFAEVKFRPTSLKASLRVAESTLILRLESLYLLAQIDILNPEELKSEAAKSIWRPFCNHFDGMVKDFNFGTLLRLDVSKEYTEENTILVTRVQFLAIEVARNRHGLNSQHFKK